MPISDTWFCKLDYNQFYSTNRPSASLVLVRRLPNNVLEPGPSDHPSTTTLFLSPPLLIFQLPPP